MTMQENPSCLQLKLLTVITDRAESKRLADVLAERHVYVHYMFNAKGTASSEILQAFGLSGTEKTVCICVESAVKVKSLMTAVVERLEFRRPGNGIAFIMPISGVSAAITGIFGSEFEQNKERWAEQMEKESQKETKEARYELVVSVIDQGYSEVLMDAAKTAGARGGTIVHARRTGIEDAVKFFGISLQAEKEIVAILIDRAHKKELMQTIVKACGTRTEARGIVLSMPVESCAGISTAAQDAD